MIVRASILVVSCVLAFAAHAQERPGAHAEFGSVAIVGSVTNSTIGVPYEKLEEAVRSRTKDLSDLSESQKDTIALLKEKLDLNQRQVQVALETVGEANVPPERLGAKFVEIAQRYKDLQTAAAAQPGDDPKVAALKIKVQKAIADGQLGKADDLLATLEKIQSEAADRQLLNAAQTTAQRGDVALAQLRYRDAAKRFDEAAAKTPQGHDDERWKYLGKEEDALYRQGDEFGDNAALVEAVEIARGMQAIARDADQRGKALNHLGNALLSLGERESGTARLEEAVAAFREASQERTRARVPLQWAATQVSLGFALATFGESESGTARLEEAVAAFREALKEQTRERVPLDWAISFGIQGVALMLIAERTGDRAMAKTALDQIAAAVKTARDGGHAPVTAVYEAQLPRAQELVKRLTKAAPKKASAKP